MLWIDLFWLQCCGSIQELGRLSADFLKSVKLAADYSVFASCSDFGFRVREFVRVIFFLTVNLIICGFR